MSPEDAAPDDKRTLSMFCLSESVTQVVAWMAAGVFHSTDVGCPNTEGTKYSRWSRASLPVTWKPILIQYLALSSQRSCRACDVWTGVVLHAFSSLNASADVVSIFTSSLVFFLFSSQSCQMSCWQVQVVVRVRSFFLEEGG